MYGGVREIRGELLFEKVAADSDLTGLKITGK